MSHLAFQRAAFNGSDCASQSLDSPPGTIALSSRCELSTLLSLSPPPLVRRTHIKPHTPPAARQGRVPCPVPRNLPTRHCPPHFASKASHLRLTSILGLTYRQPLDKDGALPEHLSRSSQALPALHPSPPMHHTKSHLLQGCVPRLAHRQLLLNRCPLTHHFGAPADRVNTGWHAEV